MSAWEPSRGASDDRFLADQVIRIAGECRPHRVFRENVTGNADGQLAVIVASLWSWAT